ncbi:MAG: helix-turn-helix transcriptional regulator [Acidimicrobiales bacterium]
MSRNEQLSSAKRRIVDALKRRPLTGPELAAEFELTSEAIRQHLKDLSEHGLVSSAPRARSGGGAGRPPVEWSLTELALDLFPDRHADLTVSLIESIRSAVGEDGLDAIVEQRAAAQLTDYRRRLDLVDDKLAALADLRSGEGYMAEVTEAPDGDGRLLVEHHCPICEAATVCQGLCRAELQLFQGALGPSVTVTREQHLLSGDERCVYRITPDPRS